MSKEKYVCNGAKIQCSLCSNPIGDLIVTSNMIKLQDTLYATSADCEKTNLIFKGNCAKSPNASSPCTEVISPLKWEGTADAKIDDNPALLEKSTIKCTYGGVDIMIIDDAQKSVPTSLLPIQVPIIAPKMEPEITDIIWLNSKGDKIDTAGVEERIYAQISTRNICPGEEILLEITEESGMQICDGKDSLLMRSLVIRLLTNILFVLNLH